jgi:hypothetical protein
MPWLEYRFPEGLTLRVTIEFVRKFVFKVMQHGAVSLPVRKVLQRVLPLPAFEPDLLRLPFCLDATVCTHLRRIFAKLGVTSRAAMIARLAEEGLIREALPRMTAEEDEILEQKDKSISSLRRAG